MALARFPALNSHAWLAATMPNSTGGVREDMTSASMCDAPEPLRLTTEGDISRSKQGHVQREQPMKGLALEPTCPGSHPSGAIHWPCDLGHVT